MASPSDDRSRTQTRNRNGSDGASAADICASALRYVEQLTGRRPDTISALERDDDEGWTVEVELVELERIPASTSVLASYEVRVDDEGGLRGYRRLRRYYRNAADGG